MAEEMIIEVNKRDRRIGLRPRSDFHEGKHIHRASHLILFNPKGRILVPTRAPSKKWYPGKADYAVGGTVGNETYGKCIRREIPEELGIPPHQIQDLRKAFKYFSGEEGVDLAWRTIFTATTSQEPKPDPSEVASVRWVVPASLKRDLQANPQIYAPYLRIGMGIYFQGK